MFRYIITLLLLLVCNNGWASLSVEDFLRDKDLLSVKISPNGRYLAQLWTKDAARIVTVKDLSAPNQPVIGQISDRITRAQAISWANNERLLITIWIPYNISKAERDSARKEDFDIDEHVAYARVVSTDVNLKDSVVLLNDNSRAKRNFNLSSVTLLPKDTRNVLMTAWSDSGRGLYKVDVYSGKSEKITGGSDRTVEFIADDMGAPLYRVDYFPVSNLLILYEQVADKTWRQIERVRLSELRNENASLDDLVSLKGSDLIYRKKNESTGYYELVIYKSKEKKFEPFISVPNRDVISTISLGGSQEVVGYAVDGDHIRHKYFSASDQKFYDQLAAKVGNYDFSVSSISADLKIAIVNISGADNPLTFNVYNHETNELKHIASAYFVVSQNNLATAAVADYLARDKQKIHSYILLPSDYQKGKQYPLVVLPHGGPQARDRANYDDFAQFIATRGYIVIKPNFRGSIGMGREFEEAGYKQWGGIMQDDLTDAVSFMVRKGYADPKKVCIVGISYGGYAALMGAVKTPDVFACSISINGVTHLRDMIEHDQSAIDDDALIEKFWFQRIGHIDNDKDMLEKNSPALQADKIATPLLIIAAKDDDIVPFEQAKMMVGALKKNKKKYTFITLEETGHNPFVNVKSTGTVYREVEKFLAANIGGQPNTTK